jgi:YegS/Rv2252/BmrU family lipid kinase
MKKTIHVIINPASGYREPILNTLNTVFRKHGISWEAYITHEVGDATRLTRRAVADGADIIASYGGDGTLMEVANGLIGSDIPLGILPGGTGNAMAFELDIPRYLEEATTLLCQPHQLRTIDVGRIGDHYFLLRCYTGLNLTYQASREMKDQYGLLAYAMATIQTLSYPQYSNYRLTIDGQAVERQGLFCLITNAGSIGGFDFHLNSTILPDDGLLDAFIIDADTDSLLSIAGSIFGSSDPLPVLRGRQITVESDPPQNVSIDGEAWGQTPIKVKIVPKILKVIVPLST